jgi:hypothetical protein
MSPAEPDRIYDLLIGYLFVQSGTNLLNTSLNAESDFATSRFPHVYDHFLINPIRPGPTSPIELQVLL